MMCYSGDGSGALFSMAYHAGSEEVGGSRPRPKNKGRVHSRSTRVPKHSEV